MKQKFRRVIAVVLTAAIAIYWIWSRLGRRVPYAKPDLFLDDLRSFGVDAGLGNLVAIQPYMQTTDYASAESFHAKLDGYFAGARSLGWLRSDTVVILPEQIGAWLVVAGEKTEIYPKGSLDEAMRLMVASNLPRFIATLPTARGQDKTSDTLFRMKAKTMATIYQETFARLARAYSVTIVGGSLYLPEPTVVDGVLTPGKGALQNVSLVFHPDGSIDPNVVRKVYLTGDEAAFASGGAVEQLPSFDTPAGELAVLVCADSWYPALYAGLAAHRARIIAVPNNFVSTIGWDEPWRGYDPGPEPSGVDRADIGQISEGEARLKYTLGRYMQKNSAVVGIHVFFRGVLWGLTSHGHTIIFAGDRLFQAREDARGALVNYWLPSP
ncbi:MAG: carbon-nitrogen hydrolase [Caldilineaceae bacterium]|nr:carbon-nitrogen hydrolase [Caldilineaceae bacterium]